MDITRSIEVAHKAVPNLTLDEIREVEQRMRPSGMAQPGFLGPEESLLSCYQRDAAFLLERQVTHKQIADRFNSIIGKANNLWLRACYDKPKDHIGHKLPAIVEGRFRVTKTLFNGNSDCPFQNAFYDADGWLVMTKECTHSLRDYTITNLTNNKSITFSGLLPHLIGEHLFFGGNTKYRLGPEKLLEVVEVLPNVDYTLTKPTLNTNDYLEKN